MRIGVFVCLLAAPAAAAYCSACGDARCECCADFNCDASGSCGTPDCIGGGALSSGESRTIQDFLPADTLLTRIEMSDVYQDTGGTVQFRVPRGLAEDIDQCAVVATQRVPLTKENIDRLVNPYGELEQILSLLEALHSDGSSGLSSGEKEELRELIADLRIALEGSNWLVDNHPGEDWYLTIYDRESFRQGSARDTFRENLDWITRFLNPDGWVSCLTTILNPDNRGALEGEADVNSFAGALAIAVLLPPDSSLLRDSAYPAVSSPEGSTLHFFLLPDPQPPARTFFFSLSFVQPEAGSPVISGISSLVGNSQYTKGK